MSSQSSYQEESEKVRHGLAQRGDHVFQSGEGDILNEGASRARWGKENIAPIFIWVAGYLLVSAVILVALILFVF